MYTNTHSDIHFW